MNNIAVVVAGSTASTGRIRYSGRCLERYKPFANSKKSLIAKEYSNVPLRNIRSQTHHQQQQRSFISSPSVIRKCHLSSTTYRATANTWSFKRVYSFNQIPNSLINKHLHRYFTCCIGFRLTDELNLIMLLLFHTPTIRTMELQCPKEDNDDNNNNNQTILCTSPTAVCDDETQRHSIVQRIIEWIQSLFKQCHNAALVTIRGTEIIIRMSPLIILTPASIIAAQFLQQNSTTNVSSQARVRGLDDHYDEYAPIQRLTTQLFKASSSSSQQQKQDQHRFTTIQTKNVISDITWDYFLNAVTALGPAFVKLCQWVATRRDIFAPNICNRLALLHDRGVCHDWSHTHTALLQAFGPNYILDGLHIEHDPHNKFIGVIGCGSAAQVYQGTLSVPTATTTTGATSENNSTATTTTTIPVAIKVLHPRFHQLVERDLLFINSVADLLHAIPIEYIRMLNFPRVARNFGSILQLQSDLRYEANNLTKFRTNFYGTGTEDESSIFFPKPIDNWISEQVLVEQLVENAVPISEYLNNVNSTNTKTSNITSTQEIRKELAIPLLNAFLKMVFWDNFVHCGT
jgi:ABC1 atypical kinase-like domain